MFFVDSPIFIKWATARKLLSLDEAISGYVLYQVQQGERAVTSTLAKDEVLIWLSRYRSSKLEDFLEGLKLLAALDIVPPSLEDEQKAVSYVGKYELGMADLVNLAIMERLGISEVRSPDKGFETVPWVSRVFEQLASDEGFRDFLELLQRRSFELDFKL